MAGFAEAGEETRCHDGVVLGFCSSLELEKTQWNRSYKELILVVFVWVSLLVCDANFCLLMDCFSNQEIKKWGREEESCRHELGR